MKRNEFINSYLNPKQMIRYKDLNIIISICIFVISSFILGAPVGRNKLLTTDSILEDYNYQVLNEIPNDDQTINVINELISKECKVNERKVLDCQSFNDELYYNIISFTNDKGITKNIHIVIDIFDIQTVYIGEVDPNYEPSDLFTTLKIEPKIDTEDYLIRFATDSLYFQAHPFGTDSLNIKHDNVTLKTDVTQVYYQSVLPDFTIDSENLEAEEFGTYLIDQLVIGNENKVKLKAYTLTFLIGVLFTLITIIILWIFFRKSGLINKFSEYYNLAAMTSIPISIIFFILLWFVPNLINLYIFIFSLVYVIVLYKINTSEEII